MVTPGFVVTQATTLLLIVLGTLVLVVRPRTRASIAFAGFAIAAGAGIFASNLWFFSLQSEATRWAALVLQLAAGFALIILLLAFPQRAAPWEHVALWTGSVALVAYVLWDGSRPLLRQLQESPMAILSPLAVGAVLLALRFGREPEKGARSQLALVSAGTLPYLAMSVGDKLAKLDTLRYLPHTLLLAAATLIWIANASRVHGSTRAARNLAILIPASALLGMTARAWVGDGNIDNTAVYGIARIITFAVLSYAIVRHQLLGIDVKLRWTISKGTIAAVFIAVFFIASETAQQFFGETLGSTYIGIAAAGMLVFTMAPLQRVAERLAERAVPVAPAPSPISASNGEREHYRVLLRRFLADGRMTRDEERALARVATLAGMTPDDTLAARHEVQAEIEEAERV